MVSRGVVDPLELTPYPYGVFSVAPPTTHTSRAYDEKWIRGFSQLLDSRPTAIRNWDVTSNTEDVIYSQSLANDVARFIENITPFFIEVEDNASTLGLNGEDRFARVIRQLEASSQKAVETELWLGTIAQAESLNNTYLCDASTATVLNGGTALEAKKALAILEQYIASSSPTGETGVIHMPKHIASILGTAIQFDKKEKHLVTRLGTPVAVGAGYTGTGPVGQTGADASDTNKWMYASGTTKIHLGKSEVVNDTLSQGYNVSGNKNDMRIKATRPAVAYFDSSIHLAVRVDLSA